MIPTKKAAHKLVAREIQPTMQAIYIGPGSRSIGLPADNPGQMIKRQNAVLGRTPPTILAVEKEPPVAKRLRSSKMAKTGLIDVRQAPLSTVLAEQPKDKSLVHLDADFCSTWRKAPTREVLSLFEGAFADSASMFLTVTMNHFGVSHDETWSRAWRVARHILSKGYHCQMTLLAYPAAYGDPEEHDLEDTGNNGHGMLRLGYAWIPAEESPNLLVTVPDEDFGLPQIGAPSLASHPYPVESKQDYRRLLSKGQLPLAQDT